EGKPLAARDLLLVSDATLVTKAALTKILLWMTDANSGAPIARGKVTVWQRSYRSDHYVWRSQTVATDEVGVATVSRHAKDSDDTSDFYAAAVAGDRQAFAPGYAPSRQNEG